MSTDRENNSLSAKVIYDLTTFTHVDYPDHLSCIVWFSGCNMRCDYCYNKDIVFAKDGKYSYDDILDFLKTRVGLLEAVVLSGGEATSHELLPFCREIKKLGFKIKLDTNGTNFSTIKELLDANLLDYVALDYKAPKDKFT
ncbi:MAG: anaerobic ribonucleoside-triphosphate reductase activating protein, partial [Sulfurimonas sp.]